MHPLPELLRQHGLWADKGLGQHFLLQESWTARIAALAPVAGKEIVEVGPGPGGLTRALLAGECIKLVAVEMDRRFAPLLEPLAADARFSLHWGDALKTSPLALTQAPRAVVSNLPYNVGTELLVQWLLEIAADPAAYTHLVLMFQLEVAERLYAKPGSKQYGRLSVLAQWLCDVRPGLHVPAGAFSPPPKVESAVVVLTPRTNRLVADAACLQQVTAAAFNQRRKMLRGALKSLTPETEALLGTAGINPESRAEVVDVEGFVRLANAWDAMRTTAAR